MKSKVYRNGDGVRILVLDGDAETIRASHNSRTGDRDVVLSMTRHEAQQLRSRIEEADAMNVNDGTEPCPTCRSGVPHGTIKLHAEIKRLRAVLLRIATSGLRTSVAALRSEAFEALASESDTAPHKSNTPSSDEKGPSDK